MKRWGWLLALLLTGCATEADRYCPVIRAQGVAAVGVVGAGCADGTTACPAGTECLRGVCARTCARHSDCRALFGTQSVCFVIYTGVVRGTCAQTCESNGDCAPGAYCREVERGVYTSCESDSFCTPQRSCFRVVCD